MTSPQRSLPWRQAGKARTRSTLELTIPDLLYPHQTAAAAGADTAWVTDLGLNEIADSLTTDRRYSPFMRKLLGLLTLDTATIAWRQAILQDFARNPPLCEKIELILPKLADLRQGHALLGRRQRGVLLETVDRLSELDLYLEAVQELHAALASIELRSDGLHELREGLKRALASESFQALKADLPALQEPLSKLASLTVGINLDADLQPVSVILLGINGQSFGPGVGFLERLLGVSANSDGESGIAPMHGVPSDPDQRPLSPLFQDLDRLTQQIAAPIAHELERYVRNSSSPLFRLEDQLAFFVAAARLEARLRGKGIPTCYPVIAPVAERVMVVDGLMNAALGVRGDALPIASDAEFGAEGRIALLTGPNSGGKTTYLQAIGLAQAMFQAGMFITARQARISPVDAILTHFPALETRQQGRLSEEAQRLRQIFLRTSQYSLVLLNESLASTTPTESLMLAEEVLSALRAIGVRAVFATHLIELVDRIPQIEARVEGDCRLMSLIASTEQTVEGRTVPTFRIVPGVPLKTGYAQEIARKYGISLNQILEARAQPRRDS